MDCIEIEYRELEEYPGYRFGSNGSVWSILKRGRGKALAGEWKRIVPNPDKSGYLRMTVAGNGPHKGKRRLIHRMILQAFVGPCPEGMEGCHNDGNPSNCRIENLRWDTTKANQQDRKRHGRSNEGTKQKGAKLNDRSVRLIRRARRRGIPIKTIASRLNVSQSTVGDVIKGRKWKHIL